METTGRTSAKQYLIEDSLRKVKQSKSYKNIEDKVRSGFYRTHRANKNRNYMSLERTKIRLLNKLTKGTSKQEKGNKSKLNKIGALLTIMNSETDIENENGVENKNNNSVEQLILPNHVSEEAHKVINETLYPVRIAKTLTNGDCFFSAIFRALQERDGLLHKVSACLSLDETSETNFIKSFRHKIADIVLLGKQVSFNYLISLNVNTYQERIRMYPNWFINEFGKSGEKLGTSNSFYERLAQHIRTPGEWVSEIEVKFVQDMLGQCDIELNPKSINEMYKNKKAGTKDVIHLYNPDEQHYEYFSFLPSPVPQNQHLSPIQMNIPNRSDDEKIENDKPSTQVVEVTGDCEQLFDPCTREPIENGNITILERRVIDIKKQRLLDISNKANFPKDITNRLELLLFILNRDEKPNENLLQYTINGQLYESYWDIVFTLGLISTFPVIKDFYMYNGKIEELINIDSDKFINNPLSYLSSKKVNEGSKSGASDITFVYKQNKSEMDTDLCASDPTIKASYGCKRGEEQQSDNAKRRERPQFFFCSSKYFNKDATKGVDKFDIQNIYTAAKKLNTDYDRKIILLVRDKGAVEEKLRKALRKYISEEASYVYGMDDLFAALTSLYDFVHSRHLSKDKLNISTLTSILQLESPPRSIMRLRLHQYLATYKMCDAIKSFANTKQSNKFLVGIVPRGGKTFIAGGIVDQLQPKRVVVLLGAKSETLSQFKEDLFEEFENFNDYECVDVVDTTDMIIDPVKKYIFIMSVELYKQEVSTRKLLQELKGGVNRADLFICDEAHLKQTTAKAVKQMEKGTSVVIQDAKEEEEKDVSDKDEESQLQDLDSQIRTDVPVVYMTGTYIKPLKAFKIPDEHVVIWDYQDIQQAKELAMNEAYFKENFGDLYDRALQTCMSYGQTYETIQKQYQQFPELYLLTTQFTPDAKDAFLQQAKGGFPTLSHLFEVRKDFNPWATPPERWYTGFTNPKGILRLLNYLGPPNNQVGEVDGKNIEPISSALKSVDNIAQRIGDRLGFFTSEFVTHSQLWFLPHMQGHPLGKRMCALAGAIFQSEWFRKHFHVIGVSSSVNWNIPGSKNNSIQIRALDGSDSCGTFSWACPTGKKSLKQCLLDQEALARKEGKGLIILAQNMLHLGISLPCVDIVVLLDTGEKVDERIQKMYRALTESTNKKGGYIIDMNYFRTVTAIMNYQITAEEVRKEKKKIYKDDITPLFNKVLDIYSIDIDKPIYGTHEERVKNQSDIQKTTIPELEKIFSGIGKKTGDTLMLENAGHALNKNIKNVLEKGYKHSYIDFLGLLKEEEEKQKQLRSEGQNVPKAEHEEESKENNSTSSYLDPKIFKDDATEQQRKEAYIEIFKTTLKLGAFGTNATDIKGLEEKLTTDDALRQVLYDTLIKRGAIQEDGLRRDRQRDFILDVLIRPALNKMREEGRDASYSKMKQSIEDEQKYPIHVEKVLDYIKEHLTPKSAERHKFGEVFTPMQLVHEMLDTLPANVWNDKSLTWLDPANGMGNFPIGVFLRLFYGFRTKAGKYVGITNEGEGEYNPGLTRVIGNDAVRCRHIVKNMLFMVELNSKNNVIARNLFKKLAPGIEPNITQMHRKDGFLADVDMKFENGTVDQFDIVMGNPPFNKGTILRKQTRKVKADIKELGLEDTKHESLWTKFVLKIFNENILKKDGYLLFITPINWFHPEVSGVRDIVLSKQIDFIKIYSLYDSEKIFGGKGKLWTAYYLIQNNKTHEKTTIVDILNNRDRIRLRPDSIIIAAYNSIYDKVYKKSKIFMNTDTLKSTAVTKCEAGPHKQIIGIYESGGYLIKYVKTNEKHPLADVPKIIINGYTYPRYYYDKAGEYGKYSKDGTNFIIIGKDLNKVKDYFDTKLSALLLKYIKFTQEKIDPKYYPDVRTISLEKITDDTLADYYGFTKEEREAIHATEYPKREYKFKEITCNELKPDKKGDSDEPNVPKKRMITRRVKRT
jgi:hypothetical protein